MLLNLKEYKIYMYPFMIDYWVLSYAGNVKIDSPVTGRWRPQESLFARADTWVEPDIP